VAAGGASSVRMTKKIEWVGSTEQGAIWSFLQKKTDMDDSFNEVVLNGKSQ
jgi:hypothetical protein